ncbi:MAG: uroporphyrinogen decarboxylase family protein [Eubacteriaceae bacterium]
MIKKQQQLNESTQLFMDLYEGRVPKRVPIELSINYEAAVLYAIENNKIKADHELNLREVMWNNKLYKAVNETVNEVIISDKAPIGMSARNPVFYQILESRCIKMSSSGYMQHPEVHSLEVNEYDQFISDPFKFMAEILMPRLYPALDCEPGRRAMIFSKAMAANTAETRAFAGAIREAGEKYGFAKIPAGRSTAPFDFLADMLRSFSNISSDIRRYSQKVLDACESITPLMVREGLGANPANLPKYHRTFIPLHMGSFISEKHFEKFYWPSFKKLMDELVAPPVTGIGVDLFVEDNWMRHLDYMASLDGIVKMQFEYGDYQIIKDKFKNTKHIVTGLYPTGLLQFGTRQECIDKAKELIDIFAPGGKYVFGFDKSFFSLKEPILGNLRAVCEYVKDNAVY